MRSIFLVCLVFLYSEYSFSQDSLKFESELNVEVRGQHLLAHFTDKPIECIDCPGSRIFDNPFNHFAIYSGLGYSGTISDKYSFDLGLMMEERSFSGGNTTLDNLQLFPRITIEVNDTISIGQKRLIFHGKGGDFWNEDFDDILRIYNLDFNGMKLRLGLGKFSLGFDVIADLSRSIGLNFHEMYKISGAYQSGRIKNVIALEINELFDQPRGWHPDKRDYNVSNYLGFGLQENVTLKAQASARINSEGKSLALGAKLIHQIKNLKLGVGMKFYQKAFNKAYAYGNVRFTDGSSYVGEQLYPLKNYFRDVNQWALLTQYQNRDLFNFEFVLHWQKQIYRKFYFLTDLDMNLVSVNSRNSDIYPIYNSGIKLNFEKNFEFIISITNKHINLQHYYQSIVASKLPFLSYGFRMNLDKIKLGTKYL